jgi:RNA polymerase sigma factor (TIGR02999 family)
MASDENVTELLAQWRLGDEAALNEVLPIIYDELRRVAHAHLRGEPAGHVLQTTALVHEAYLRLVSLDQMTFDSRIHFFAVASRFMRRILVDVARRQLSEKRGAGVTFVDLDEAMAVGMPTEVAILALNEALDELAAMDPRSCRVVELRFFVGLTTEETATALDVSRATVERDWTIAKAWLRQYLSADGGRSAD